MARSRNIKPGFFSNDELAEVSPLGRLLFIALWTMADKAGRLEDRPKRIKVEALPYDDCDAESLLSELAERGFILRYARGGRRFIQVVNFAKHQNPHTREPESEIPEPEDNGSGTGQGPPGSCAEPGASTVLGNHGGMPGTGPAGRIPDSGFPLPDSPSRIPDYGGEEARATPAPGRCRAGAEPTDGPPGGEPTPRACRIPDGFPTEDWLAWARQERPDLDAGFVAAKFRDYWAGVPGAKGRKLDWPATWRNFVRDEFVRKGRPGRESTADHNKRELDAWLAESDDGRTIDA